MALKRILDDQSTILFCLLAIYENDEQKLTRNDWLPSLTLRVAFL